MSNFIDNEAKEYAAGFHVVVTNKGEIIEHKHSIELRDAMIFYDLKVQRFYKDYMRLKDLHGVLFKVSDKRIDKLCEFGNYKL